jgi:hypothetical protein
LLHYFTKKQYPVMKTTIWASALLFSTLAAWGLIDYVQKDKAGTLRHLYAEDEPLPPPPQEKSVDIEDFSRGEIKGNRAHVVEDEPTNEHATASATPAKKSGKVPKSTPDSKAENDPDSSANLFENDVEDFSSTGEDAAQQVLPKAITGDTASPHNAIAEDTAVVVEKKINARAFSRAPLVRKGNIKTQPAKQIQTKH